MVRLASAEPLPGRARAGRAGNRSVVRGLLQGNAWPPEEDDEPQNRAVPYHVYSARSALSIAAVRVTVNSETTRGDKPVTPAEAAAAMRKRAEAERKQAAMDAFDAAASAYHLAAAEATLAAEEQLRAKLAEFALPKRLETLAASSPSAGDFKQIAEGEDMVRILQWNLLADGLSDDAFLVHDAFLPFDPQQEYPRVTRGR